MKNKEAVEGLATYVSSNMVKGSKMESLGQTIGASLVAMVVGRVSIE